MQERHAAMERFPERQVDRLSSVLELTSAQREKILEITRQAGAELDRLRRESWAETQQRVQKMNEAIRAVLTPDQLPKFDAFRKEQSERMHRFFPDRRDGRRWPPRNEHGPGGSPPPPPPPEES
jgi:hypothetical protein